MRLDARSSLTAKSSLAMITRAAIALAVALIAASIAIPAGAGTLSAQTIRGRVLNELDRQPVAGALVVLIDAENLPIAQAFADETGNFLLRAPAEGIYRLRGESVGYHRTVSAELEVAPDEVVELDVLVTPDAIPLDSIRVLERARLRMELRARGSRVDRLDRERIEELLPRARTVSDLVRWMNVPGMVVRPYRADPTGRATKMNVGVCIESGRRRTAGLDRCNMVEVYVDDVRVAAAEETIEQIEVENIESIEFYSPLQAGAEYGLRGSSNGVLLIYTRIGRRP